MDGSAAARNLNDPLPHSLFGIQFLTIAPNQAFAVYLADQDTRGIQELYAVDLLEQVFMPLILR